MNLAWLRRFKIRRGGAKLKGGWDALYGDEEELKGDRVE